jgi:hypothetical protein
VDVRKRDRLGRIGVERHAEKLGRVRQIGNVGAGSGGEWRGGGAVGVELRIKRTELPGAMENSRVNIWPRRLSAFPVGDAVASPPTEPTWTPLAPSTVASKSLSASPLFAVTTPATKYLSFTKIVPKLPCTDLLTALSWAPVIDRISENSSVALESVLIPPPGPPVAEPVADACMFGITTLLRTRCNETVVFPFAKGTPVKEAMNASPVPAVAVAVLEPPLGSDAGSVSVVATWPLFPPVRPNCPF